MSHFYISQTYAAAALRLDEACAWLETLGIEFSRTRIGRYRELFAALAKHQLDNTLYTFYEQYPFELWVNAAHEVAELVRMFEGLGSSRDPKLAARLRDALKGHELYVLDDKDRSGRDFSLELSMAAKFARAGFPIDFGHDADVKTVIGGTPFYVECKRIKSASKVQKRIKEGLKQLHTRYVKSERPEGARGMLVLSIGKAINSNLGLLEAEDPKSLGERAFAHNSSFIKQYRSFWQMKVDPRTLGVVVVLDAPGLITLKKQLITCHEVTVSNCVPASTAQHAFLLQVFQQVFLQTK